MQFPALSHAQQQQQHQQQQQQQQHGQQGVQYSLPPAPTFASLGGTPLSYMSTLGSLAQAHHAPVSTGAQGLSAAIPPTAYLMQQTQQFQQQQQQLQHYHQLQQQHQQQQQQQQHQQHAQPPAQTAQPPPPLPEKKSSRREDANFGLVLPLHKVKRLIKSENTVKAVSSEASYAIARAAELIMEQLLEKAYDKMTASKRTSIEYDDIGLCTSQLRSILCAAASAISRWTSTDFLRDMVPETQTLSELIERVKRQDAAATQTRPAVREAAKEQGAEA